MTTRVTEALRALQALGAGDVAHVNEDLKGHLLHTYERLREWGNPESTCMAGLFHAVYGTDGFGEKLLGIESRSDAARIIGKDAEQLVYVYGGCDRVYFYPRLRREEQPSYKDRFSGSVFVLEEKLLRGFCELTFANELDVASGDVEDYVTRYGRYVLPLFSSDKFRARLSENARDECIRSFFPNEK